MGLYRTILLAPFIKIPVQYKTCKRNIRSCGKHVSYNESDKFCPTCGGVITTQKISSKTISHTVELICSENLFSYIEGDNMYLFSNRININTDDNTLTVITPTMINDMMIDFSVRHKKDIEVLEKKLKLKVKIEFGFACDYR